MSDQTEWAVAYDRACSIRILLVLFTKGDSDETNLRQAQDHQPGCQPRDFPAIEHVGRKIEISLNIT